MELIDVRTPAEFREVHVDFAKNVPLDALDPNAIMTRRDENSDQPLYVICRSGSRGGMACQKFQACGYASVVNVAGGTLAWDKAGLPVVRGPKAISLEQQVRIAAGFLSAAGAVLTLLFHPVFLTIPFGVGLGLMHAGATNSCIMGMMLSKMPWNRVQCETAAARPITHNSCCS